MKKNILPERYHDDIRFIISAFDNKLAAIAVLLLIVEDEGEHKNIAHRQSVTLSERADYEQKSDALEKAKQKLIDNFDINLAILKVNMGDLKCPCGKEHEKVKITKEDMANLVAVEFPGTFSTIEEALIN